jgi:hypothetical protein
MTAPGSVTHSPQQLFGFKDVCTRDMFVNGRDRLAVSLDGSRVLVAQTLTMRSNTAWKYVATLRVFRGAELVHTRSVEGRSSGVAVCPVTGRVFWAVETFGIGAVSLELERGGLGLGSYAGDGVALDAKGLYRFDDAGIGLESFTLRALCCRASVVAVAYSTDAGAVTSHSEIAFLCSTTGARTHEIGYHDLVCDMAFVADEDALVVANGSFSLEVVSVSRGTKLQRLDVGRGTLTISIACTGAGELVVVSVPSSLPLLSIAKTSCLLKVFPRSGVVFGPPRVVHSSSARNDRFYVLATHGDAIYALCLQACQNKSCVVFR